MPHPCDTCSGHTSSLQVLKGRLMGTQTIQRRRWAVLGVLVVGLLAIDNTVLNVVGGHGVLRWLPGRRRPTIEEIDQLVAAEVAAAERDLAAMRPRKAVLSESAVLPEGAELSGSPELSQR